MKYMKHPKLRRRKNEDDRAYNARRKRDRAERRKQAAAHTRLKHKRVKPIEHTGPIIDAWMETAPMKRKRVEAKMRTTPTKLIDKWAKHDAQHKPVHPWLVDRSMHEPHVVLRIDDYNTEPADRGQFYPAVERTDDKTKAIWPTRGLAQDAAEWAAAKFGRQYGVFKLVAIVETTVRPTRVWEV